MTDTPHSNFLILSAAYIGDDMAAELGHIPPAFLPLGGKRLFAHQCKLANGPVFLTLPEDYTILPVDQALLERLKITVIRLGLGLSLKQSLLQALGEIGQAAPVEILFGDTLVQGRQAQHADLVSYQNDPANHFWSYYAPQNPDTPFISGFGDGLSERRILCGHFKMSNSQLLEDCLQQEGNFIEALNAYERQQPFTKAPVETWFDFGHLALYYQSKKDFFIARAFNNIDSDGDTLRKSSPQTSKMRAEAAWFKQLPHDLRLFTPRYLGRSDHDFCAGYRLEYIYQPLLSDLFVFGNLPGHVWSQIMAGCFSFLDIASQHRPPAESPDKAPAFAAAFFNQMFAEKTKTRFAQFLASQSDLDGAGITLNGINLGPYEAMIDALLARIRPTAPDDIRFMHGDFFFGNTFFDFRAGRVLTIDPRAMTWDGMHTYYGDFRYDIAKLAHSVVGKYDHILNQRSQLTEHSLTDWEFTATDVPEPANISNLLFDLSSQKFGIEKQELLAMTALLFLSMLPLHAESPQRQKHLFANGLRLAQLALEDT